MDVEELREVRFAGTGDDVLDDEDATNRSVSRVRQDLLAPLITPDVMDTLWIGASAVGTRLIISPRT